MSLDKKKIQTGTIALNKKVSAFYEIGQKYETGIVLIGAEVKSVQLGQINLKGSYITVEHNEVFLKNCHISAYKQANLTDYSETKKRKLLLNKSEIIQIEKALSQKGNAILPIVVYLKKKKIKVEIAICKSKKLHDRRDDLKKKAQNLEIKRTLKKY